MASKLVCDIDNSAGDDVRKVTFALDGAPYEIDLSAASLAKLTKALEPFVAKARNLATAPASKGTRVAKTPKGTSGYVSPTADMSAEQLESFNAFRKQKHNGEIPKGRVNTTDLAEWEATQAK